CFRTSYSVRQRHPLFTLFPYTTLFRSLGFAIQPNARDLVEKSAVVVGVPATYVQATPDLMMGDLLKNMRSSQIFSVCGLPEVKRSEEHTSELQSLRHLVCRLLLENKKK